VESSVESLLVAAAPSQLHSPVSVDLPPKDCLATALAAASLRLLSFLVHNLTKDKNINRHLRNTPRRPADDQTEDLRADD